MNLKFDIIGVGVFVENTNEIQDTRPQFSRRKKIRVSPWILKFLRICVRKRTRPQSAHRW